MAEQMSGERMTSLVVSIILFILTLPAVLVSVLVAMEQHPIMFFIFAFLSVLPLVPAGLELVGQRVHRAGLATLLVAVLVGLWSTFTSPSRDPTAVMLWIPVLVLWGVLAYTRSRARPEAAPRG